MTKNTEPLDFLKGGGETGEIIRGINWESTPLGPAENWPTSLKTIVSIMLSSSQPIWIGWGKDLIKLYNDPYRSIAGGKHPGAMGLPASEVWGEIWDDIEPLLKRVMEENEGIYIESQLLIMERNGYSEETYYTFSYNPVLDDDGKIGGMFCTNTEDTQKVIGARQLATLKELTFQTVNAQTVQEVCELSIKSLETNPKDIPCASLYFFNPQSEVHERLAMAGAENENIFPKKTLTRQSISQAILQGH